MIILLNNQKDTIYIAIKLAFRFAKMSFTSVKFFIQIDLLEDWQNLPDITFFIQMRHMFKFYHAITIKLSILICYTIIFSSVAQFFK